MAPMKRLRTQQPAKIVQRRSTICNRLLRRLLGMLSLKNSTEHIVMLLFLIVNGQNKRFCRSLIVFRCLSHQSVCFCICACLMEHQRQVNTKKKHTISSSYSHCVIIESHTLFCFIVAKWPSDCPKLLKCIFSMQISFNLTLIVYYTIKYKKLLTKT